MSAWFVTRVSGWADVDRVREALGQRLKQLLPADVADEVALAAHELAENGIKYSTDRELELSVEIDRPQQQLRLIAKSTPEPAEVASLMRELTALAAATDPLAYYQDKMQASQERADGRAALGLARIRCEARMKLDHELVDGTLRLIASRVLP